MKNLINFPNVKGMIDGELYIEANIVVGKDSIPQRTALIIKPEQISKALQPIHCAADEMDIRKERHAIAQALAEDLMRHLINDVFAVNDTVNTLVQ